MNRRDAIKTLAAGVVLAQAPAVLAEERPAFDPSKWRVSVIKTWSQVNYHGIIFEFTDGTFGTFEGRTPRQFA